MIPRERSLAVQAWYAQLAAASETPALVQHLVRHWGELLPRFVAYFEKLRALPRRIRRALGRRRGLSFASLALLLALGGGRADAAIIPVDGTSCRLADAILASNTDAATNGCPAGSGTDTIVLDADVTLSRALPAITKTTRIEAGAGSILDGNGKTCLSTAYPSGDLTLEGLTIRNCVRRSGGAVYNQHNLTISHCTITGNRAKGIPGGGAVQNYYGTVYVLDSTISGNTSEKNGGGIRNSGGFVSVERSSISGNTAAFLGGGIDNFYGTLLLTDSVISGNHAPKGGGLSSGMDFEGADLRAYGTTVSGNTAVSGAGIYVYAYGEVDFQRGTISGNVATEKGGGIYFNHQSDDAKVFLTGTTVTGNSAGIEGGGIHAVTTFDAIVQLSHALISGNEAPSGPEMVLGMRTEVTAGDFNVIGLKGKVRSKGFAPGATDIVPARGVEIDDILAPLADNGGPTPTHALVPGSPAVDVIPASAGNCSGTVDQRGQPRPVGPGCDAGSFELVPSEPEPPS